MPLGRHARRVFSFEVFSTVTIDEEGAKRFVELYSLASTPIERRKKVVGSYNPFDPSMEEMGEKCAWNRCLKS